MHSDKQPANKKYVVAVSDNPTIRFTSTQISAPLSEVDALALADELARCPGARRADQYLVWPEDSLEIRQEGRNLIRSLDHLKHTERQLDADAQKHRDARREKVVAACAMTGVAVTVLTDIPDGLKWRHAPLGARAPYVVTSMLTLDPTDSAELTQLQSVMDGLGLQLIGAKWRDAANGDVYHVGVWA